VVFQVLTQYRPHPVFRRYPADIELQRVRPFLETWLQAPSVRAIEKRGWSPIPTK
jgi:hypothetical protein